MESWAGSPLRPRSSNHPSCNRYPFLLSSRATGISYLTALTSATRVVLFNENHMQLTEATTFDRKSGEAEGSAVPRTFAGYAEFYAQTELSSRPERTRISCHADLVTSTYAPFRKERCMRLAKPTSSTGNPWERSGEICVSPLVLYAASLDLERFEALNLQQGRRDWTGSHVRPRMRRPKAMGAAHRLLVLNRVNRCRMVSKKTQNPNLPLRPHSSSGRRASTAHTRFPTAPG
jgi:hypothetical protein